MCSSTTPGSCGPKTFRRPAISPMLKQRSSPICSVLFDRGVVAAAQETPTSDDHDSFIRAGVCAHGGDPDLLRDEGGNPFLLAIAALPAQGNLRAGARTHTLYVQTELMGPGQASDPGAMPLKDFIAETMNILKASPD